MPSDPDVALPEDYRSYGVVLSPSVETLGPRETIEALKRGLDRHICAVDDGQPLCDVTVPDDAPVYPFRGQRRHIAEGLEDCCPDCREQLTAIAVDGEIVTDQEATADD